MKFEELMDALSDLYGTGPRASWRVETRVGTEVMMIKLPNGMRVELEFEPADPELMAENLATLGERCCK